jgi:diguanylate cyclase (GGDEF)-like protein
MHNRRFLNERIDTDLALALRRYEDARRRSQLDPDDADLCCFLIDIDHFKEVNDRHGHAAGDAVLVQMRERLLEAFRAADYLVRWGGEEFLVVSRAGSRRHAAQLAERARQAVAQRPFTLPDGQTIVCTCSIGFACFPLSRRFPAAVSWGVVLGLADCGLYAAKRSGRNRWDGVLDADALEEAALSGRLGDDGRMDPRLHRLRGP